MITLNADRTIAGTLTLTSITSAQDARVTSPNGSRLTVSGTLNALRGVGGIRHFDLPLTITATGTFALDALSTVYVNGDGSVRENRLSGTVTVPGGATLLWRVGGQTVRQLAGTITGTGNVHRRGQRLQARRAARSSVRSPSRAPTSAGSWTLPAPGPPPT